MRTLICAEFNAEFSLTQFPQSQDFGDGDTGSLDIDVGAAGCDEFV
jgi:hypothetical protein